MLKIELKKLTMNLLASEIVGINYVKDEEDSTFDRIVLMYRFERTSPVIISDIDLPDNVLTGDLKAKEGRLMLQFYEKLVKDWQKALEKEMSAVQQVRLKSDHSEPLTIKNL